MLQYITLTAVMAGRLQVIYFLPKYTKAVPAGLIAIIALTLWSTTVASTPLPSAS